MFATYETVTDTWGLLHLDFGLESCNVTSELLTLRRDEHVVDVQAEMSRMVAAEVAEVAAEAAEPFQAVVTGILRAQMSVVEVMTDSADGWNLEMERDSVRGRLADQGREHQKEEDCSKYKAGHAELAGHVQVRKILVVGDTYKVDYGEFGVVHSLP